MDDLLRLSIQERRAACESAVITVGLPAQTIEKDFWVCWVLRELFGLPAWGDRLTFKGGTSLSKCWKLIDRFSEDVDVVIDRNYLGFGGDHLSAMQLKRLREICAREIREDLLPVLSSRAGGRPRPSDSAFPLSLGLPRCTCASPPGRSHRAWCAIRYRAVGTRFDCAAYWGG